MVCRPKSIPEVPHERDWQGGHVGPSTTTPCPRVVSEEDPAAPPESSPLWGVVLVLAEIATRVERSGANEPVASDENAA